ncbi:MAG: hypothetical protein NUV34_06580 [Sulfuricaulis sp.]|nr:hypothetical protein [Sulfuricaulis sp.]
MEKLTDQHEPREVVLYPDEKHVEVPERYTYLRVYSVYYDDAPVVMVVVEKLKDAA